MYATTVEPLSIVGILSKDVVLVECYAQYSLKYLIPRLIVLSMLIWRGKVWEIPIYSKYICGGGGGGVVVEPGTEQNEQNEWNIAESKGTTLLSA